MHGRCIAVIDSRLVAIRLWKIRCEERCRSGRSETLPDRLVDSIEVESEWSGGRLAELGEVRWSLVWQDLICAADAMFCDNSHVDHLGRQGLGLPV